MKVAIAEIVELVCLQLGVEQAGADDRLREDLGADSADLLNLIVAVEDRYGLEISEEEVGRMATVADLHRLAAGATGGGA